MCYSSYTLLVDTVNFGLYPPGLYPLSDYIPFRIISHVFGISASSLTQWNTSILILIIFPFGLYPVYQQYSFPPKNGI